MSERPEVLVSAAEDRGESAKSSQQSLNQNQTRHRMEIVKGTEESSSDSDLELISVSFNPTQPPVDSDLQKRVREEVTLFRLDRLAEKLVQRSQCGNLSQSNLNNGSEDAPTSALSNADLPEAAPQKKLRRSMCSYFD